MNENIVLLLTILYISLQDGVITDVYGMFLVLYADLSLKSNEKDT